MIQLRPYQQDCIEGLRSAFRAGFQSPLLVLPTGGGKTVCFSYLTSRLVAGGKRVALLCHRGELVAQISRTLRDFDVKHGLITPGSLYDPRLLAHVASVQTLIRRLDRVKVPDYVIIDEAHHCILKSMWGQIIAYWKSKNPQLKIIGVTATPTRLSGEGLGDVFQEMVLGPSPRELMGIGALSEYRLFRGNHNADLSGVGKRAGDFIKGETEEIMSSSAIVGDTIAEYREKIQGAPAVTFEVSVKNAQMMAERFRDAGYTSACLDGNMKKDERKIIVEDFSAGKINVLTSCDLLSEGFDVPGIVGVILRRPTMSLVMYLQQVGRGLRPMPGKDSAIILDQVGNSARHGLPDDPREWSLLGDGGSTNGKADNIACRECATCRAASPASAIKCRECGTPFPIKSREIEEVAGKLSEVEVERARIQAKRDQAAAQTLDDLIRLGQMRGMKNPAGWARHVHAAREAKKIRKVENA